MNLSLTTTTMSEIHNGRQIKRMKLKTNQIQKISYLVARALLRILNDFLKRTKQLPVKQIKR